MVNKEQVYNVKSTVFCQSLDLATISVSTIKEEKNPFTPESTVSYLVCTS